MFVCYVERQVSGADPLFCMFLIRPRSERLPHELCSFGENIPFANKL